FGGPPVARPAETGQPSQYPRCDPATSAHMHADARRGPGVGPAGVVDGRGARGTTGRHNATPVARQERAPADGRFTTRDTPGRGGRCPSLTRRPAPDVAVPAAGQPRRDRWWCGMLVGDAAALRLRPFVAARRAYQVPVAGRAGAVDAEVQPGIDRIRWTATPMPVTGDPWGPHRREVV